MLWKRLVFGLLLAVLPASQADAKEALTSENWKRVRDHVLPDKADSAWRKIPWHSTLWAAVVEAQREKKPILLWAMNGHALACT